MTFFGAELYFAPTCFCKPMSERPTISREEMLALHQQYTRRTMTESERVRFRSEREKWAEEGRLPESFTDEDLRQIAVEVRVRVELLSVAAKTDDFDLESLGVFLEKLKSLRNSGYITGELYSQAIAALANVKPGLRHGLDA